MPRIIPNLWFDTEALEAADFYCSVFPNSDITRVVRYSDAGPGPAGTVVTVEFHLDGEPFVAINGGPMFHFTEAVSLMIDCADQDQVDHYWEALSAGGEPSMCGWLKDRYGLSWQVIPDELGALIGDAGPARAERAVGAMLSMSKIDIGAIRDAADGGGDDHEVGV